MMLSAYARTSSPTLVRLKDSPKAAAAATLSGPVRGDPAHHEANTGIATSTEVMETTRYAR